MVGASSRSTGGARTISGLGSEATGQPLMNVQRVDLSLMQCITELISVEVHCNAGTSDACVRSGTGWPAREPKTSTESTTREKPEPSGIAEALKERHCYEERIWICPSS